MAQPQKILFILIILTLLSVGTATAVNLNLQWQENCEDCSTLTISDGQKATIDWYINNPNQFAQYAIDFSGKNIITGSTKAVSDQGQYTVNKALYKAPGTYTIYGTVEDWKGYTDDETITLKVTPAFQNNAPTADFSWSQGNGYVVTFNGKSSSDSDGDIVLYKWDFNNDGIIDKTSQSPGPFTHTLSEGRHFVTLTVVDDCGAEDSITKNVILTEEDKQFQGIDVSATPTNGDAPLSVAFSCSATGGNSPVSYSWNFGDGNSLSGSSVSHTYTAVGEYTATCTATDDDGDTISGVVDISVTEANVAPIISTIPDQSKNENTYYSYTISASDANRDTLTYTLLQKPTWLSITGNIISGTTPEVSKDTDYTIIVKVRDTHGAYDTESYVLTVIDTYNDIDFSSISVDATPKNGEAPLNVAFTCLAQGGNTPIEYMWNFGDGSTGNGASVSHTYTQAGEYTATCSAGDNDGDTISGTVSISVTEANVAPIIQYIPDQQKNENTFYSYPISASDENGDALIYELIQKPNWLSITGNIISGTTPEVNKNTDYIVVVKVSDGELYDTESYVLTVIDVYNNKDFTDISVSATPTAGEAPLTVAFSCSATGGNNPISYTWNYGDGTTGTSNSHTYTTMGTHTATCTATDNDGDTISGTVTITVNERNIAPVISAIPDQQKNENSVYSYTVIATDANNDELTYELIQKPNWLHLSGNVITGTTPEVLQNTGYPITVKVTDTHGAYDTESYVLTVIDVYNNKDFTDITVTANQTTAYVGQRISFACEATGGNTPIEYTWDFDNGEISTFQYQNHTFATAGIYTVECEAEDNDGDTISDNVIITINDWPVFDAPIAQFDWTPTTVRAGDTVTFDASNSYDPDGHIVTYQWDFTDDFNWDENGVTSTFTYIHQGTFKVTLRVTDNDGLRNTLTQLVYVQKQEDPQENLTGTLGCNPDVVQGKIQRCSMYVTDDNGEAVENAEVVISYISPETVNGNAFGTCHTNFKGYCHVDTIVPYEAGTYGVEAVASKGDYTPAKDQASFLVWEEQYDIVELEVFSDVDFSVVEDTFYRGEDMYVAFAVKDTFTNEYVCDESIVTEVFLKVNNIEELPFIELTEISSADITLVNRIKQILGIDVPCVYKYGLNMIPLSDDYLGEGRVFGFAFNFADNTAGQASKVVTILNNPVTLDLPAEIVLNKYKAEEKKSAVIDLDDFANDIETADNDLLFTVEEIGDSDIVIEEGAGHTLKITAPEGVTEGTTLRVHVDDTDGSTTYDDISIRVTISFVSEAPVANAGADQSVLKGQTFTLDGSNSYDPDGGDIVLYSWDFGNGHVETSTSPTRTAKITAVGDYTIVLTVTDDEGETDTDAVIISVGNDLRTPACSDGKDNDYDGLTDMNDPGCSSPSDDDEGNIAGASGEEGLKIESITIMSESHGDERITEGDYVTFEVTLENEAGTDTFEDLRVTIMIPEMGVKTKSSEFDLKKGKRTTETVDVYVPYDLIDEIYDVQISIGNSDLRRSTFRWVDVAE